MGAGWADLKYSKIKIYNLGLIRRSHKLNSKRKTSVAWLLAFAWALPPGSEDRKCLEPAAKGRVGARLWDPCMVPCQEGCRDQILGSICSPSWVVVLSYPAGTLGGRGSQCNWEVLYLPRGPMYRMELVVLFPKNGVASVWVWEHSSWKVLVLLQRFPNVSNYTQ